MSQIDIHGNSGNVNVKGDTINKNTKITISIGSVIILTVIAIVFLFNSNSLEKSIVGTWQTNDQYQIFFTFEKDGTFSMSGGDDYLDGNYTFLNDNIVQVHMNYYWADLVLSGQISISGKKMTIENISDPDDIFGADGATITLTKTK